MPKVFDCFPFNDELDVLEHRLRLLSSVVTTFVVVESRTNFQGGEKPLNFLENRERFCRWTDKICHVVVENKDAESPWERKHAQHRAFETALVERAADDDLVLVGDCDEIPFPRVVLGLVSHRHVPTRLRMTYAVYWANAVRRQPLTDATVAFRWSDRDHPALGFILGRAGAVWGAIPDPASVAAGGWHYGDCGEAGWIATKVSGLADDVLGTTAVSGRRHVARCRSLGVDYRSSELLTLLNGRELPPEVTSMGEVAPSSIRQANFPPRPLRVAYAAFTASRRRLPDGAVRWADRHIVAFLAIFGLPILIAERIARPLWRAARGVK